MIASNFDWAGLIEFSIIGLLSGGLLSLIALGFVLIYKGTGVINFAMGEFMMLGAYFFFTANVIWGLPTLIALVLTLGAVAAGAAIVERTVLRPMAGQPVISILMATIGLSSVLHGGVAAIWGGHSYEMPRLLSPKPFVIGEILIPGTIVWNFVLASVTIALFTLYFRYSKTGITIRAVASDPISAYVVGIDVRKVQRLVWMFAGVAGAIAGILVASMNTVSPSLGYVALGVLAVVILGGLDSIVGAIVAGLIVGLIESLTSGYLGGKVRDIVPYVTVLAILLVRPYGLFGTRQIERL